MTIYLDYIFIENIVIDYILLIETSHIARKNISNKKTILAAIISSCYVVFMMYLKIQELNYVFCKILLVIVMIYIAFKPKEIIEYLKIIVLFFLISVINIGSLMLITNLFNMQESNYILKLIIYIASFSLSKFFENHMWEIYKREIKNDDLIYDVKLELNRKIYKYKAFLDTGNSVYSYSNNLPVIFAEILDDEILKELESKEYFNIRTVTLSNEANKKAYIFDNVEITKKERKWFVKTAVVFEKVKLSKNGRYNMLLNYILYTQDLGGIKIWI